MRKNLMNSLLVVLAAVTIVGCGRMNGPSPLPQGQTLGIGNFVLRGVITNLGAPVQGASVMVSNGSANLQATTDADGKFEVVGLGTGDWTVTVSAAGYSDLNEVVNIGGDVEMTFALLPNVATQNRAARIGR